MAIAAARHPTSLFSLSTDAKPPVERLGYAAAALLTLSPVVAHATWRPVATALGTDGDALRITIAALFVSGVAWAARVPSSGTAGRWLPGAIGAFAALVAAVVVGGGDPASTAATAASLLGVALFAGALLPWMLPRLPLELDGLARRRKGTTALLIVVAAVAVVQTARLSTFMGDPARTELSALPTVPFLVRHSCLTAYVEGARLASEGAENVYDAENWPDLSKSERSRALQTRYAPFQLDAFAYPPPFLLLPRALLLPLADFRSQRALWFGLNGLALAVGLWTVASWIEGRARLRALLLAPVLWLGLPSLVLLQIGNVHATVIVVAMLAMVAFASERPALGGALLALAILSKISPGLLVLMLLVRRRFRDVLWTAGFGLGFVVLSLAVFGVAPFHAFLSYQMPRLGSGEALSFMTGEESLPINMSPFGIPFKLAYLGAPIGDVWKAAGGINLVFSAALLGLLLVAARKEASPRTSAIQWLAVLTLGTLRSPFAPAYVMIPMIWIFSLWAAEVRKTTGAVTLALAWILLGNTPLLPTRQLVVVTLVQQCILVGILAHLLLRRSPPDVASADSGDGAPGESSLAVAPP